MCCICLMNLSFLEASSTTILQHSPDADGKDARAPLNNPYSLLRALEKLLSHHPAKPQSGSGKSKDARWTSGLMKYLAKSENARWTSGLIRYLAKSEENAAVLGKKKMPKYVVEDIRFNEATPSGRPSNFLDDFSRFDVVLPGYPAITPARELAILCYVTSLIIKKEVKS